MVNLGKVGDSRRSPQLSELGPTSEGHFHSTHVAVVITHDCAPARHAQDPRCHCDCLTMARLLLCGWLVAGAAVGVIGSVDPRPWLDPTQPPAVRAAALIWAMTPEEKLVLLQGSSGPGIGNTAAIPRLGVPSIGLEDGPNGVADWETNVTTWPSSMTMAASWDTQLMEQFGAACGREQRGKGFQVRS